MRQGAESADSAVRVRGGSSLHRPSLGVHSFSWKYFSGSPLADHEKGWGIGKAFFDGEAAELMALVEAEMEAGRVVLAQPDKALGGQEFIKIVAPKTELHRFRGALLNRSSIGENDVVGVKSKRRDDELPYFQLLATAGEPLPIQHVEIILYARWELARSHESEIGPEDFQLITVQASPFDGERPMDPVTMMRNHFMLPGGSLRDYDAERFARSILFAQEHVNIVTHPETAGEPAERARCEIPGGLLEMAKEQVRHGGERFRGFDFASAIARWQYPDLDLRVHSLQPERLEAPGSR